ncbi:tRNA (guanosine(46)-N7)-methyltransferase TrmB [Candidatus Nitrosacidococcus sp. I8]|uniref:tRNA (guanosine(46)-N7)-methyltransferase TrmB n=1 Tax=Candidatus Nitrosacidococcus sp. I8 TaxID=2942908 RepID=UPI00222680E0|nr:tRNA (guanosine(46)-N7)-methyltransferase TrmB [Candidatus Nitrosacidococcus sp. I8]CAH9018733.1 tRNA (guanine-N(7)-)-methyltransferase [Candidatus Nitrosacidococcus sp. I8]
MPDPQYSNSAIRSFVRREGRITVAQKKALEELWSKYGLTLQSDSLELASIFPIQTPIVLEIGFGNGDSLARQALENPAINFLGVEVYRPGIGHLLTQIESLALTNLQLINEDGVKVLTSLADQSLAGVQIFFSDPWPKKRHHKRRLIQPAFVDLLWHKTIPQGWVHLATDWENYAIHMNMVFEQYAGFSPCLHEEIPKQAPQRPLTKFENRGQNLGHGIWDLWFRRI